MAGEREKDGIRKVEGARGVRWQAKAAVAGFKPTYKTFPTRNAALRWKKSTEAAMIERRHFAYQEADRHTLADMINRYVKQNQTEANRKRCLLRWCDFLGSRLLSDIGPADIAEVRDKLLNEPDKPRSPATANRYLAYLSAVYSEAMREWQWVRDNPVKAVKKRPEPKGRVRYLSKDELSALLKECGQSRSRNLYALVVLALSTGARAGELLDLRWPDVDLAAGRAILHHTKNGERRAIAIAGKALTALQAQEKSKRADCDRVFPSPNGIERYNYQNAFRSAVQAAGIQDFRFHDLRHTAASYLAMNGASVPEIAAVLGHKSWAMTQRYSHLADGHVSAVVQRMNRDFLS